MVRKRGSWTGIVAALVGVVLLLIVWCLGATAAYAKAGSTEFSATTPVLAHAGTPAAQVWAAVITATVALVTASVAAVKFAIFTPGVSIDLHGETREANDGVAVLVVLTVENKGVRFVRIWGDHSRDSCESLRELKSFR